MISLPIFRGAVSNAADVPSLDLNFSGPSGFFAEKGATPTLTRGSVATYTDSAGVLRTTNSNLMLQSSQFDSGNWVRGGLLAFGSGSTANGDVAPDGTTTADVLVESTTNTSHFVYQQFTSVTGSIYTGSLYVKKYTAAPAGRWIYLYLQNGLVIYGANFDLLTGVLTSQASANTPTNTSYKVENSGAYWRISISMNFAIAANSYFTFERSNSATPGYSGSEIVYAGDNTTSMTVWGAQIEQASYAGPYSPTTTVATNDGPRIDYDPVTLACKGLLIEEARTNLFLHSNNFADVYWQKSQITFANAVGVNSPDGSTNATLITATTATADGVWRVMSGPVGGTYSIYIKRNVGSYFSIWTSSDNTSSCQFNILTNTIVSLGTSNESASVTPINNGWVRLSVTRKASVASSNSCYFAFLADTGNPVAAIGDNHYIYGAQLEVGTFPTSYIPTTTTTVTRNVETCYLNGTNFSSWFNSSEGTFVVDFRVGVVSPSYTTVLVASDGGVLTNNIRIYHQSQLSMDLVSGSSYVAGPTSDTYTVDTLYKSAIAYKVNDFAFCLDSGTVTTDTSGTVPVGLNQLLLASWYTVGNNNNQNTKITISRVRYYNKRLANSRLQQRTSPTLDWRSVGPVYWPNYKASITNTIATGTVTDATVEGGGTYAGGNKFVGGLLLPDGRVFCNPFAVLYGSIYDPTTNSFTDTPNLIAGAYNNLGSVLLKNGNIYLIPSLGGNLGVVYNPSTNAILTAPTGASTAPTGSEAYCGGVVMQDGRVFCVPSGATVARIYNPVTNVLESPTITNGAFPGSPNAYAGGVLLTDGRVFLVPRSATIGKIYNPITNEITNTGNSVAGTTEKYLGGVLMPNGKVFCVPLNSTVAKIYDPATNLFEPDIAGFGPGLLGGVVLPNGNIFCGAHASTGSPKIYNPSTGAITTAAGSYGVSFGWGGTVLMNDGRVFCIPFLATKSKIYGGGVGFNTNIYLSAYYNKL